jgi:hypothetical protein
MQGIQGIDVVLTSPQGELDRIGGQDAAVLGQLLPDWENERFSILRYIDPCDTTVFNGYQMPLILRELDWLLEDKLPPEETEVLEHLKHMALRCQEDSGRFLKFTGD